jgi:hypothetical protein
VQHNWHQQSLHEPTSRLKMLRLGQETRSDWVWTTDKTAGGGSGEQRSGLQVTHWSHFR